jgi:hypothetical protein
VAGLKPEDENKNLDVFGCYLIFQAVHLPAADLCNIY